jgi:hypothetical protein
LQVGRNACADEHFSDPHIVPPMSFDRRLGLSGLIVGLIGIPAFYLWPDKKWIGWVCLLAAVVLVLVWFVLELRKSEATYTRDLPRHGETTVLTLHASSFIELIRRDPRTSRRRVQKARATITETRRIAGRAR